MKRSHLEYWRGRVDAQLDAHKALESERDRRYSEVNVEREKALKIKEEADRNALVLAREIQAYRDAQHNDLLRKWQEDRGKFVATDIFDAKLNPLIDFVAVRRGEAGQKIDSRAGAQLNINYVLLALAIMGFAASIFFKG